MNPGFGSRYGHLVEYKSENRLRRVREFGINYYDGLTRHLKDVADISFEPEMEYLHGIGVRVIRVNVSGFWPINWQLFFSDEQEYFTRMDRFVEACAAYDIRVIAVLFWAKNTLGEIVEQAVVSGLLTPGVDFTATSPLWLDKNGNPTYAEYTRDLGRSNSGSVALAKLYVDKVVARYKDEPAIAMWEIANERNLSVDYPEFATLRARAGSIVDQGMYLPSTSTDLQVLPAWTGPDDLVMSDVTSFYRTVISRIRMHDTWRAISNGNAMPRPAQYNLRQTHSWTQDTMAQNMAAVAELAAGQATASLHAYYNLGTYHADDPISTVDATAQDWAELIRRYVDAEKAARRPVIIGEYGVPGDGLAQDEKDKWNAQCQGFLNSRVQIAMPWTYATRNTSLLSWWIHPGVVDGYPATPKMYVLDNNTDGLWSIKKMNDAVRAQRR